MIVKSLIQIGSTWRSVVPSVKYINKTFPLQIFKRICVSGNDSHQNLFEVILQVIEWGSFFIIYKIEIEKTMTQHIFLMMQTLKSTGNKDFSFFLSHSFFHFRSVVLQLFNQNSLMINFTFYTSLIRIYQNFINKEKKNWIIFRSYINRLLSNPELRQTGNEVYYFQDKQIKKI